MGRQVKLSISAPANGERALRGWIGCKARTDAGACSSTRCTIRARRSAIRYEHEGVNSTQAKTDGEVMVEVLSRNERLKQCGRQTDLNADQSSGYEQVLHAFPSY